MCYKVFIKFMKFFIVCWAGFKNMDFLTLRSFKIFYGKDIIKIRMYSQKGGGLVDPLPQSYCFLFLVNTQNKKGGNSPEPLPADVVPPKF